MVKKRGSNLQAMMESEEELFRTKVYQADETMKEINKDKQKFDQRTNIVNTDLELIREENKRIRKQLQKFQEDVSDVINLG